MSHLHKESALQKIVPDKSYFINFAFNLKQILLNSIFEGNFLLSMQ